MQGYNIIFVFDEAKEKMLMCKRKKDPYKGLLNLVGGKIIPGEPGMDAAYRELNEETGITRAQISLKHLMDFTYYYQLCYVEVYVGKLHQQVHVHGDENDLLWTDLNHNFFDLEHYAGEGNIGHMIEQIKLYDKELFG